MKRAAQLTARWTLRRGVYAVAQADGSQHLTAGQHSQSLGRLGSEQLQVLRELAESSMVTAGSSPRVPTSALAGKPLELIRRLDHGGWLHRRVEREGKPLYRMRAKQFATSEAVRQARPEVLTLSRFAAVRRDGGALVLDSPVATHSIDIIDPALVASLVAPASPTVELIERSDSIDADAEIAIVADAWRAGLLVAGDEGERDSLHVAQWHAHDLEFHERSRLRPGRRLGEGFGSTSWAKGVFPKPPERRPCYSGPVVPLARPDQETQRANAPGLYEIINQRRSIREYDDERPITLEQLGEFLYLTAAVRPTHGTGLGRPYPTGGALYELELYVLAERVTGLEPGLFHYDAHTHQLVGVPASPGVVRALLRSSSTAMAGGATPQLVMLMSARFERLMWKYEAVAYALVLKHVGVLMQTMYLVATAMDLAPCALGTGDSSLFAMATGEDERVEAGVGEFALGSRPSRGGDVSSDGAWPEG